MLEKDSVLMSRSFKKPYGPCCGCKTKVLKRWKKSYNSKMRNTSIDDVPDNGKGNNGRTNNLRLLRI